VGGRERGGAGADPSDSLVVSHAEYYGNPAGLTDDVAVVRATYAAFAARDVERVLEFAAADCELRLEGTARGASRTEPYRGHAGVREYFADVARVWDELTLHADDIRAVPGSVIVMGHVDATAAGVRQRRAVVWTWKLREGKATSIRVADMGELLD
jgi:ketosteroid isomerase-like protein